MSWLLFFQILLLMFLGAIFVDASISGVLKTYVEHKALSERTKEK